MKVFRKADLKDYLLKCLGNLGKGQESVIPEKGNMHDNIASEIMARADWWEVIHHKNANPWSSLYRCERFDKQIAN